jgi:hypothetical protein
MGWRFPGVCDPRAIFLRPLRGPLRNALRPPVLARPSFTSLGRRNLRPPLVSSVDGLVREDHPYRHTCLDRLECDAEDAESFGERR